MQFISEMSEIPDLYSDYSENHAATHDQTIAPLEERTLEVTRVLDVQYHPATRKKLPTRDVPRNVIQSRRGHAVYVESFTFKPTSSALLAQMTQFLQDFTNITARFQMTTEHYLVQMQEACHFAFGSVTPPGPQEIFFEKKRIAADTTSASCKVSAWKELIYYCQKFLDEVQPSMVFKEIKMNDDGHVVLRMTIQQADAFLDFRNTWQRLFSDNYQRYTEAEKITTLASVLGVVDLFSLSKSQRAVVKDELNDLFATMTKHMTYTDEHGNQKGKAYPFSSMEFSEASNRMLQKQDMLGSLKIHRGYVHRSERPIADKTVIEQSTLRAAYRAYLQKNLFKSKKESVRDAEYRLDKNDTCRNK